LLLKTVKYVTVCSLCHYIDVVKKTSLFGLPDIDNQTQNCLKDVYKATELN